MYLLLTCLGERERDATTREKSEQEAALKDQVEMLKESRYRCKGAGSEVQVQRCRCRDAGAVAEVQLQRYRCRGAGAEMQVQLQRYRCKGAGTEVQV